MKKAIKDTNDTGYKYILYCKKVFIELLKSFVKEGWVNQIDESNIMNVDKSYIADDFKTKESDLVYKVSFKDSEVIFYVLIELQSSVDFKMPYRLLSYMMGIWNDIVKDAGSSSRKKDFKLPAIIPIVLYNGISNWTACKSYKEMILEHEDFGEYMVDFKYILIDVNRYSDDELLKLSNLIGSVFLLDKKVKNKETIISKVEKLLGVVKSLNLEEKELFSNWVSNIIGSRISKEERNKLVKSLKESEGMEMVYNLQRTMDKEFDRIWKDGAYQGKLEGKLEGKLDTAREALRLGAEIDFVKKITGLDIETLQSLKKELFN